MHQRKFRILAVASGGGHWVQMQRLRPALENWDTNYATVGPCDPTVVAPAPVFLLPDANARTPFRMLWLLVRVAWLVLRLRPDMVITTGAAPGYWAVRLGRLCGARTIFLDSIANAEKLSLSAHLAFGKADVTLTQWPEVAASSGAQYWGAVV
jgi:hypothetical protein